MNIQRRWFKCVLLPCAAACCFVVAIRADGIDGGVVRSFEALTSGSYEIPLGEACTLDEAAEKIFLRFLELERDRDTAGRALYDLISMDDRVFGSMPNEYRYALALGRLNELLRLCEETKDTEAGLSSVLLLAADAFGWEERFQTASVESALHSIASAFDDEWQAKVGVLIHSSLLIKKRSQGKAEALANAEKAITMLRAQLPSKEMVVDPSSAQFQAVSKRFKVSLPLRGSFLVSILSAEYRLGNHGYPEYFSKAEATCEQVIAEYPGTEFAKFADDIGNRRIPRLREMMDAANRE